MGEISAVVVSYASGSELLTCVGSLLGSAEVKEVVIVDNGPPGSELPAIADPRVRVVNPGDNLGFAGGANAGARETTGEILLFVNPDVALQPSAIEGLAARLRDRPGACSPVIEVAADGSSEHGITVDLFLIRRLPPREDDQRTALFVSGCCLATNRSVFAAIGGFDQRYFMFCEDLEYCWQVWRRGFEVSVADDVRAHHEGGGSTPGGYVRDGHVMVSEFRIALRERNSIAAVISCAPGRWLWLLLLCGLARLLGAAAAALVLGRSSLATELMKALAWNVRELHGSLARRRHGRIDRGGEMRAWRRIQWRCYALSLLRVYGRPMFADSAEPVA
ncbi:MAG: glycosyltransferase family 2 protein [Candidatus Dormibacteraeota bacterium]|nr:glycosyltransferase family 2 protein [Candidatus Dormibacteraeota bacterium]